MTGGRSQSTSWLGEVSQRSSSPPLAGGQTEATDDLWLCLCSLTADDEGCRKEWKKQMNEWSLPNHPEKLTTNSTLNQKYFLQHLSPIGEPRGAPWTTSPQPMNTQLPGPAPLVSTLCAYLSLSLPPTHTHVCFTGLFLPAFIAPPESQDDWCLLRNALVHICQFIYHFCQAVIDRSYCPTEPWMTSGTPSRKSVNITGLSKSS